MTLTLCICTMNRASELTAALGAVRAGTVQPDILLVSDDGHSPETQHIAESFGATYQHGPAAGLGQNRNACITATDTDFVAFIDDDVVVPPRFVETLLLAARVDTVVTGCEYTHRPAGVKRTTAHNADFLGFQRRDPQGDYRAIVINATVFPRRLFTLAIFDELTRYGYEELDMARQARALGFAIEFDVRLWVDHYPAPSHRDLYAAGLDAARLYLTHRARLHYSRTPLRAHTLLAVGWAHALLSGLRNRRPLVNSLRIVKDSRRLIRTSSPPQWLRAVDAGGAQSTRVR